MKTIIKFFVITAAILAAAACTSEAEESPVSFSHELVFTASHESVSPDTKTIRMEDGSTWWNAAEEISVFYGSGSGGGSKFTSKNTTPQKNVEFGGIIETSGTGDDYWAVYPYTQGNECDGSSITTVIPFAQVASEGNFSGDAFPAIARTDTKEFAFLNICGGVKFSVSRSDIKSVTFKGNGLETLAGKVRVVFDADGKPEVAEVIDGKTRVTIVAPDGGTFNSGKYYYIALLPTALDNGFTMTFVTANSKGSVNSSKSQTVKRSVFGVLDTVDSKVTEWNCTVPETVDLGLSVKWASFNVGATEPEEFGDYFAWGETKQKDKYDFSTYLYCNGAADELTKYCPTQQSSFWGGEGSPDGKTVLSLMDDAASVNWGATWRTPTVDEWKELRKQCSWKWIDNYIDTGVNGYLITSEVPGHTDKSIFLPHTGCRDDWNPYGLGSISGYWSSSLYDKYPYNAQILLFTGSFILVDYSKRSYGNVVRPVYDDQIHPESISINKNSLSLHIGDSEQLVATVYPSNSTNKNVTWSSSNPYVVTVDAEGVVTAILTGIEFVTATTEDGNISQQCMVIVDALEAVDLGLSVNWASINLGAVFNEEYGDYYAWGETGPYYEEGYAQDGNPAWKTAKEEGYWWSSYKFCNGDPEKLVKYCTSDNYFMWDGVGSPDNKTLLDLEDDAAHVRWGGNWRIPTHEEWTELIDNCTWKRTNYGMLATSKKAGYTDKSIFLPSANIRFSTYFTDDGSKGLYWSSSLSSESNRAWFFWFNPDNYGCDSSDRCCGFSVRPVCPKE